MREILFFGYIYFSSKFLNKEKKWHISPAPNPALMKYHLFLSCIIPPSYNAIGCGRQTDEGKMAALIKTRVQGRSVFEGFNNRRDSLRQLPPGRSTFPEHLSRTQEPRGKNGARGKRARSRLRSYLRERLAAGRLSEMALWKFQAALARLPSTSGHLHKFDLLRPKTRPPPGAAEGLTVRPEWRR